MGQWETTETTATGRASPAKQEIGARRGP